MRTYRAGIDIGSTTVKLVLLNDDNEIIYGKYRRHGANTQGALAELLKEAKDELLKIDPDVLSSSEEEIAALNAAGFRLRDSGKNFEGIQPRYVFRLHLNGRTEEEIFAAFEQKTRYNVRLSGRKGVEVRLCGEEMVESFAAIMRETGERDGFIVRNADYFRRMLQELGEHARLYMAFYEDKPVAELVHNTEAFEKVIIGLYQRLVDKYAASIASQFHLAEIAEEKINAMPPEDLEELILGIMRKELNAVVLLGGVIGIILGFISVFLNMVI